LNEYCHFKKAFAAWGYLNCAGNTSCHKPHSHCKLNCAEVYLAEKMAGESH